MITENICFLPIPAAPAGFAGLLSICYARIQRAMVTCTRSNLSRLKVNPCVCVEFVVCARITCSSSRIPKIFWLWHHNLAKCFPFTRRVCPDSFLCATPKREEQTQTQTQGYMPAFKPLAMLLLVSEHFGVHRLPHSVNELVHCNRANDCDTYSQMIVVLYKINRFFDKVDEAGYRLSRSISDQADAQARVAGQGRVH